MSGICLLETYDHKTNKLVFECERVHKRPVCVRNDIRHMVNGERPFRRVMQANAMWSGTVEKQVIKSRYSNADTSASFEFNCTDGCSGRLEIPKSPVGASVAEYILFAKVDLQNLQPHEFVTIAHLCGYHNIKETNKYTKCQRNTT